MSDATVWVNPAPSSTRFCRPISFAFLKEDERFTLNHYAEMQAKIDQLVPSKVNIGDVSVSITHSLYPCMVDGKVCSALASTSTSRCHVCGAYPRQMNDLHELVGRPIARETFRFGLSPLHFRIR